MHLLWTVSCSKTEGDPKANTKRLKRLIDEVRELEPQEPRSAGKNQGNVLIWHKKRLAVSCQALTQTSYLKEGTARFQKMPIYLKTLSALHHQRAPVIPSST